MRSRKDQIFLVGALAVFGFAACNRAKNPPEQPTPVAATADPAAALAAQKLGIVPEAKWLVEGAHVVVPKDGFPRFLELDYFEPGSTSDDIPARTVYFQKSATSAPVRAFDYFRHLEISIAPERKWAKLDFGPGAGWHVVMFAKLTGFERRDVKPWKDSVTDFDFYGIDQQDLVDIGALFTLRNVPILGQGCHHEYFDGDWDNAGNVAVSARLDYCGDPNSGWLTSEMWKASVNLEQRTLIGLKRVSSEKKKIGGSPPASE